MITYNYEIIIHSETESPDGRVWPNPVERHTATFSGENSIEAYRKATTHASSLLRGRRDATYTINPLLGVAS